MDAIKYTMTPEQIAEKYSYAVDVVYRIIEKGFWQNKGIFQKDDSGSILICPEAFNAWYKTMVNKMENFRIAEQKTKKVDAIAKWIAWTIAGCIMTLGILLAVLGGQWIIILGAGVFAILTQALLQFVASFVAAIIWGSDGKTVPATATNETDDREFWENYWQKYYDEQAEYDADMALSPAYSRYGGNVNYSSGG